MLEFENRYNQYHYTLQKRLDNKETVICKVPIPSGGAKRIKSIYWSASPDVNCFGTLALKTTTPYALWEKLEDKSEVSTAVTALKFQNTSTDYKYVYVWVIME